MEEHRTEDASGSQGPATRELVDFILQRQASMEQEKGPWISTWEEIMEMILPNYVSTLRNLTDPGKRGDHKIFNGHGNWALHTLTRGLLGHTVTASKDWFYAMQTDRHIRLDYSVQNYARDVVEAMHEIYRRSNFYYMNEEYVRNCAAIGTTTMLIQKNHHKRGDVVFSARHIGEIFIDEDNFENIDTQHRKFYWSPRQLIQAFGRENMPKEIVQRDKNNSQKKDIPVIHAMYPNYEQIPGNQSFLGMPVRSYYVLPSPKRLLAVGGYWTWPAVTWRWEKLSNETMGRGPGFNALVDLLSLQQISKSNIETAQYAANPPSEIPIEMKGNTKLLPGGKNYYVDPQRGIRKIQNNAQYHIGMDQEERRTEIINRHFMVDIFSMLQQIERMMTATETERRIGEAATKIGPVITRMAKESYTPIHQRVYQLAADMGMIPDMPPVLQDYLGQHGRSPFEIEYIGSLFRLQKQVYEQAGFNQFVEQMGAIAQVAPGAAEELGSSINFRRMSQNLAQSHNLDPLMMNTDEEYAEIKEAIRQQQAALQQQQQMESMGRAANGLNQPAREGSMMEELIG